MLPLRSALATPSPWTTIPSGVWANGRGGRLSREGRRHLRPWRDSTGRERERCQWIGLFGWNMYLTTSFARIKKYSFLYSNKWSSFVRCLNHIPLTFRTERDAWSEAEKHLVETVEFEDPIQKYKVNQIQQSSQRNKTPYILLIT